MRTKRRALALALAATALTASAANAAIELQAYSFTATTGGPITNHSGSFVLAYDDVADTYSLNSIVFSLGTYQFDKYTANVLSPNGQIFMGGLLSGVEIMTRSTNDFILIKDVGNGVNFFGYTTEEDGYDYVTLNAVITRTELPTPGAVPEPGAWALMILGFGAAGAALRRRRFAIA